MAAMGTFVNASVNVNVDVDVDVNALVSTKERAVFAGCSRLDVDVDATGIIRG